MLSSLVLVFVFILLLSSDAVSASPAHVAHDAHTLRTQLAAGPTCGKWTLVTGDPGAAFEYKCASGSVSDKMPVRPRTRSAVITRDACQAWCQSAHPVKGGASSCCELSISADGDHCSWSDGKAEPTDNEGANQATSVITSCASGSVNSNPISTPQPGEMHTLDRRYPEKYECEDDGKKLFDAIGPLECGKPGDCGPNSDCCCSQIYLPKGLWNIAQKYGVTQGTCSEKGWTVFAWHGNHAGVHYNVFGNPLNVTLPVRG
ncbi:hypothetical protein T492DRAFT_1015643 [Pavlovales sp. CCMP2436]|nr:hypothetical protein T492DRAFT_1015643 [Pavlovales sp. CCMP2436]